MNQLTYTLPFDSVRIQLALFDPLDEYAQDVRWLHPYEFFDTPENRRLLQRAIHEYIRLRSDCPDLSAGVFPAEYFA